jgi:hypothetical protein
LEELWFCWVVVVSQFFPLHLHVLLEKEKLAYQRHIKYVPPPVDMDDEEMGAERERVRGMR